MSVSRQRARDLVGAYDHSLEQQIVGRGSSLASSDEELWKQVEALLRDGDAQETHCLGVDPLRVMEESLKAAAASSTRPTACGRRVRARGGLQGLGKAFEVLEQAALNLYLGPWREEYRVIKMHSGTFTHYITPVLSAPQIENLFGLLGYQTGASRAEQLRLQSARVSPASLDDLLRLSCAFFVARCECCLLLAALGKHAGDAQWELSVVRERQRGSSLQVALETTEKTLEANRPPMEPYDGEVDLYRGEQVNGGQRQAAVGDHESPRSLTWAAQSAASPPAVRKHSNGVTPSPLESDTTGSSSGSRREGRRPCGESRFDNTDSQSTGPRKSERDGARLCSCLHAPHFCLRRCVECDALHDITCASLEVCGMKGHTVEFPDGSTEDADESGAAAQSGRDEPESTPPSLHPITYHDCCDLTRLDPRLLCRTCAVFHSASCREGDSCQATHDVRRLGVCSCGRLCARKPLVLCRYCGNEYCSNCWYRNPVTCSCGQTFDQSTSV